MPYKTETIKRGTKDTYCIKDTTTGKIEVNCTKYIKHKTRQNRAPKTVLRIARILPYYMNFLEKNDLTLKEVANMKFADQSEHFYDFLMYIKGGLHCESHKKVNNNTANSYLQTVFGLYNFLHRNGELPYLTALDDRNFSYVTAVGTKATNTYATYDGYLPKNESMSLVATKKDVIKILSACKCIRDRLLIQLMEETGLRIGEALGIKYTEDIDFKTKRIFIRYRPDNKNNAFAKNAEERFIKMSDETFCLLNMYLSEYSELFEKTDYLFIVVCGKTKGRPLSASSFYSNLETIGKRAGLHVTNHMLRHYFADERRKSNWSIADISYALGHKRLSTTENYLHVTPREIEDAQDAYFKNTSSGVDISGFL